MANKHKIFRSGYGNQAFELDCNNDAAYDLASFLFSDLPGIKAGEQAERYDIIAAGPLPMWSLWQGEKQLYYGKSRYQVAYILMNEVIFHCINRNAQQHALHAGAVSKGDICFILPGQSGNGKSTLTAWLVSNGYRYLTDELILLSHNGQVLPLTRPISLKVNETHNTWLVPEINTAQCISSDLGSMIPHRLLNPDFSVQQPYVTHIIFPEFKAGTEAIFQEISPAQSCLRLLQSHVNARNLKGHGISEITTIVKQCKSYKLTYSSFDDLEMIFRSSTSIFP